MINRPEYPILDLSLNIYSLNYPPPNPLLIIYAAAKLVCRHRSCGSATCLCQSWLDWLRRSAGFMHLTCLENLYIDDHTDWYQAIASSTPADCCCVDSLISFASLLRHAWEAKKNPEFCQANLTSKYYLYSVYHKSKLTKQLCGAMPLSRCNLSNYKMFESDSGPPYGVQTIKKLYWACMHRQNCKIRVPIHQQKSPFSQHIRKPASLSFSSSVLSWTLGRWCPS
jgi:hypothetical protein